MKQSGDSSDEPNRHANDQAWVARIIAARDRGDLEPFGELVEKFAPRVTSVIRGVLGREADVEDAAQEVFIKLMGALQRYDGLSSLYTWIYRVAVNTSLDQRKKLKRHRAVNFSVIAGDDEDGDLGMAADTRSAEHEVGAAERAEAIHEALAELPEKFRMVLILREIDGLAYEEIAQALDLKKGTVESRLFRARAMLREIAERRHLEDLL